MTGVWNILHFTQIDKEQQHNNEKRWKMNIDRLICNLSNVIEFSVKREILKCSLSYRHTYRKLLIFYRILLARYIILMPKKPYMYAGTGATMPLHNKRNKYILINRSHNCSVWKLFTWVLVRVYKCIRETWQE